MTDVEVARRVGITRQRVAQIGRELGLPRQKRPSRRVDAPELTPMTPEELKAWRLRHGNITQLTLSRMIGVAPDTIARWERGFMESPKMLRLALELWEIRLKKAA